MKHSGIAILLLLGLSMAACVKPAVDPPVPPPVPPASSATLRLTVVPEWGGEPLQAFTEYANFMDYRVTVELLKMYFGDIRLIGEAGDTSLVKDVDLFDLGAGPVVKEWQAAPGQWSKLRAGLGVPASLNYADPAGYASGHPLNVSNGTYWTWTTGYRYVMFEGRYDTDPESSATLLTAYSIHPGMDPSYIEFELLPAGGITLVAGMTTEVVVRVAVDRFFDSPEYQIDLATENTAHGTNLPLQWKLVNNVVLSMEVE